MTFITLRTVSSVRNINMIIKKESWVLIMKYICFSRWLLKTIIAKKKKKSQIKWRELEITKIHRFFGDSKSLLLHSLLDTFKDEYDNRNDAEVLPSIA